MKWGCSRCPAWCCSMGGVWGVLLGPAPPPPGAGAASVHRPAPGKPPSLTRLSGLLVVKWGLGKLSLGAPSLVQESLSLPGRKLILEKMWIIWPQSPESEQNCMTLQYNCTFALSPCPPWQPQSWPWLWGRAPRPSTLCTCRHSQVNISCSVAGNETAVLKELKGFWKN